MSHNQYGLLSFQGSEQLCGAFHVFEIQTAGRFIEDQYFLSCEDGRCNGTTLLFCPPDRLMG